VKINKNERKGFHSSNKENLTCWDKIIMANFLICTDEIPVENQILNLKIMKQTLPVPNVLLDCVIFFYYFSTTWVICSFFKGKQSTWEVLNMAAFYLKHGEGIHILM
jgi:hypothetical protein